MSNVVRDSLTSILMYFAPFFLLWFFRGVTGHGREIRYMALCGGSFAVCMVGTHCLVFSGAVMEQPQFGHVLTVLDVHVPQASHLRMCPRIEVLQ